MYILINDGRLISWGMLEDNTLQYSVGIHWVVLCQLSAYVAWLGLAVPMKNLSVEAGKCLFLSDPLGS
jgi:hypothetical protein